MPGKGQKMTEEHKAAISRALRNSPRAKHYHKNVQTGKVRQKFSVEWRATMSVSHRLGASLKGTPEYEEELQRTIEALRQKEQEGDD